MSQSWLAKNDVWVRSHFGSGDAYWSAMEVVYAQVHCRWVANHAHITSTHTYTHTHTHEQTLSHLCVDGWHPCRVQFCGAGRPSYVGRRCVAVERHGRRVGEWPVTAFWEGVVMGTHHTAAGYCCRYTLRGRANVGAPLRARWCLRVCIRVYERERESDCATRERWMRIASMHAAITGGFVDTLLARVAGVHCAVLP